MLQGPVVKPRKGCLNESTRSVSRSTGAAEAARCAPSGRGLPARSLCRILETGFTGDGVFVDGLLWCFRDNPKVECAATGQRTTTSNASFCGGGNGAASSGEDSNSSTKEVTPRLSSPRLIASFRFWCHQLL